MPSTMSAVYDRTRTVAHRGFSLIELLIVVAIILIIAAIAIPSMLRSRLAANQATAAANLRTISTASVSYWVVYSNGYPPSLAALGGGLPPATCNTSLLVAPKSGYRVALTGEKGGPTRGMRPWICGLLGNLDSNDCRSHRESELLHDGAWNHSLQYARRSGARWTYLQPPAEHLVILVIRTLCANSGF